MIENIIERIKKWHDNDKVQKNIRVGGMTIVSLILIIGAFMSGGVGNVVILLLSIFCLFVIFKCLFNKNNKIWKTKIAQRIISKVLTTKTINRKKTETLTPFGGWLAFSVLCIIFLLPFIVLC